MYLPTQLASRLGVGGADPDYGVIDDIVQWFVRAFEQLWSRLSKLFSKLGPFVVEEYHKTLAFFLDVAHAANEPLKQNPYLALFISMLVFIGPWILLLPLFLIQIVFFLVLSILGFGVAGITGGSPAALYQSLCYGGHTPAGSVFAMLQSTGTGYNVGTASNWVLAVIRIISGMVAAYVLFGILLVDPSAKIVTNAL